jgi:hypothetical protein
MILWLFLGWYFSIKTVTLKGGNMEDAAIQSSGFGFVGVLNLAFVVLMIASLWKVFVKAGKPGWACLIPVYNIIVMLEICGKPMWWIVLMFIPVVNIIVLILLVIALAKSFGKDTMFAVGLILLGIVFYPILAFGDAKYVGPQS